MKRIGIYTVLKDFFLMYISQILIPKKDISLPEEIYSTSLAHLKISYCTTCMGRFNHIKKTYLKNINDNIEYDNIEFVLVNYNSKDGLNSWAKKQLSSYISKGVVNYFHTTDPQNFHMAKAKNLAHRLATGDIVVNLDADNFLGKNHAFYLNFLYQTSSNKSIAYCFSKPDFRFYDTAGKIALKKSDFLRFGGYNENLLPYGQEDLDLIRKLSENGIKTNRIELINFLRTIKHSTKTRKRHLGTDREIAELRKENQKILIKQKDNEFDKKEFQQFHLTKNFSKNIMKA